ncbi:MAG TPA: hypothetical protein VGG07_09260 [Solirubrobacteraceae bacterium]
MSGAEDRVAVRPVGATGATPPAERNATARSPSVSNWQADLPTASMFSAASSLIDSPRQESESDVSLSEWRCSVVERRLANFVDFIGERRGTHALARRSSRPRAEGRVEALSEEVDALALIETPPDQSGAEGGSNTSQIVETAGIEPASAVA